MKECTRSPGEALLDHVGQEEDVRIRHVLGEVLHHQVRVVDDPRGHLRSDPTRSSCQPGGEGDDEKTVDDEEEVVPLVHREGQVRVACNVLEPGKPAKEVREE